MKLSAATFLMSLLLFLGGGDLWAQQFQDNIEFADIFADFGEIPEEYLQMEADHDYPYEYLQKESAVQIREGRGGIEAVIDHLVRIKVYSDGPLEVTEASLIGIPYYFDNDVETITELEAITHHPDGEQHIMPESAVARSDINSRYRVLEFEFPNVEQGAVLEYKYRVIRRYIEELPDFYFSEEVPTRSATFILQNENFLRYDVVPQNVNFDFEYSAQQIDTSSVPRIFTYERPDPVLIETWEAEDIPAVEEEPYISSLNDLRGKLKFQISEFGIPRQHLVNSWEFVAAQVRRNMNPLVLSDRHTNLRDRGAEIADRINSTEALQDSIFALVNETARYNELPAVFADGDFSHVLDGEPADQAEINMALMTILRGAGIDAYPLYISDRNFGKINESFPSMFQFNRVLVWSEIDGEEYVMDASYPLSYPNLIPPDAYTDKGFVLRERDYFWHDLEPGESRFDLAVTLDATLSADGSLEGSLKATAGGYNKQQILEELNAGESGAAIVRSSFFEIYPDAEILSAEIRVPEGNDGIVEINAEFSIGQYAVSYQEGLEFRPMIVGYLFDNPFESTERNAPIMLDAPEQISVDYRLSLPDGFRVDGRGETRSTRMDGAELTETYESTGQQLNYSLNVDISNREFSVDDYGQLREIYQRWVEISNDIWYLEN